jgi:hypothetical protein
VKPAGLPIPFGKELPAVVDKIAKVLDVSRWAVRWEIRIP